MLYLRYNADLRTLAFIAVYFSVAVLSWMYFPQSWHWATLVVMLNAVLSFFCAVIVHNTIHSPMFRKKSLNRIMQVILSFTYGHPVSAYVPGHNFSHHQNTQSLKDNIRTTKARFRWNFLNQLLFFYIMSFDIIKAEMRFIKLMKQEKPKWYRQYLIEMLLLNACKLALLLINWQLFLFVIFIPHHFAAWGIVSTNYWQHDGCDASHPFNHSRNFKSKTLNWFCFNNGYHGLHHEKPGMHWSLLPAAHKKIMEPHLHPNLNRNSLFVYLWQTCIFPGKRVDYLGNPIKLPPKRKDENWVDGLNIAKNVTHLGSQR